MGPEPISSMGEGELDLDELDVELGDAIDGVESALASSGICNDIWGKTNRVKLGLGVKLLASSTSSEGEARGVGRSSMDRTRADGLFLNPTP